MKIENEAKSLLTKLCETEFMKKYSSGERYFSNAKLNNINLQNKSLDQVELVKAQLNHTNLEKIKLSNANLKESSLISANIKRADISKVNLEEANLESANLSISRLTEVNFTGACLHNASFYCAELNLVNFSFADLRATVLSGVDLSKVNLQRAFYNRSTMFPSGFNPEEREMIFVSNIETLESLVTQFEHICQCSYKYLGKIMTAKYFNSSRPDFLWLNNFELNKINKIDIPKSLIEPVTLYQIYWFKQWMALFISSCSKTIKNFQDVI